jgi:glycosyltransferase involved in cell wall biosynthesis
MSQTVLYFIDSRQSGGAEQVMLYTWSGLDRARWRPVLIHHPESGLASFLNAARRIDVEVREVPRLGGLRSLGSWLPRFMSELRAEEHPVFHAHLNYPAACQGGLIAAALARLPAIVVTAHLFPKVDLGVVTRTVQQVLVRSVDCYIGVSHDVVKRLGETLGLPARKLRMVHNGVPLDRFEVTADTTLRASLAGDTTRPIILTIGRLVPQKGHRHLLEAATLVRDAVFVFAGEGPDRGLLEAQSRDLGLGRRVIFLGHRLDIPELLACSDLMVLPSLFEGLPLSVLEAMAAAKPVIASDVGGTNETIVSERTGLLVPPADPAALAAAIRRLLSDRKLAEQLATAGKARVREEFSAARMVQSVTQIYEHLLST